MIVSTVSKSKKENRFASRRFKVGFAAQTRSFLFLALSLDESGGRYEGRSENGKGREDEDDAVRSESRKRGTDEEGRDEIETRRSQNDRGKGASWPLLSRRKVCYETVRMTG